MNTNIKEQLEAIPGAALVEFYDATRSQTWPVCAYKREDCAADKEHSHGTLLVRPVDGWPDVWLWDAINYRLVIKDSAGSVIAETDYDAIIASLKSQLAEAQAKPEPMTANPPADVLDVIDWTAPPKERQEALLVKLREVIGLIGLAEDRGGRADPSLYRKRDAIESGIRYNRATLAETI